MRAGVRKPKRRELLDALAVCQSLFGRISSAYGDRNPNRAEDILALTSEGFDLCVEMRSGDKP